MVLLIVGVLFFGGLCTCGILSAVAIPAFVKYTKKSKIAEAQSIMRRASMGIKLKMEETCTLHLPLAPTSPTPQGGQKLKPVSTATAWEKYGVDPNHAYYFSYSGTPEGDDTYIIVAQANFDTASSSSHTIQQSITLKKNKTGKGKPGNACTVSIQPSFTLYEFE